MKSFFNWSKLSGYKGIIYFGVLLLATHYLWNFVVDGYVDGDDVSIFGKDMSGTFHSISVFTTKVCYHFMKLFPNTDTFTMEGTLLYFTDGKIKLNIIGGCSSIKQIYIFIIIILFYYGPAKHKLWYIPVGAFLLFAFNIIRICSICVLTKNHPERFGFLHDELFRYLFYGLIFLLWVIWEEKYAKGNKAVTKQKASESH